MAFENEARNINLQTVLEEGLRKNPFEKIRSQQKIQLNLEQKNIKQEFWFPQLSLELESSNHRIDRIQESTNSTSTMGAQSAPTGSLGFKINEYTIFNWGKDYLQYKNDLQSVERSQQRIREARRKLKFNLIAQYFQIIRRLNIKNIYQEQLRQTSFVHRTAKEKLKLKKIKVQEYYQTRSEFLRAQTEYQNSLFELGLEQEELSNLLGDQWQSRYQSKEKLKFIPLNIKWDQALEFALRQSIAHRDAKLELDQSLRNYEKTVKENLPLPTFSLSLGAYQTGFDPSGTSWSFETTPGNKNIEVVAGINMKWTLFGRGGFFNSRFNENAYLQREIAQIKYSNVKREIQVKVRTFFKVITYLEKKIEIAEKQLKNASENYDSVLSNYLEGHATYSDIKLSIDNFVLSSINAENVKYDHLIKKLELADLMGVEDFPGENFEQLAVK